MTDIFRECDTCAAKAGSPRLCSGCLHNRATIYQLHDGALEARDNLSKLLQAGQQNANNHEAKEPAQSNYEERSHSHCWNQKQPPACGLKGKHLRCCLCPAPAPTLIGEKECICNEQNPIRKVLCPAHGVIKYDHDDCNFKEVDSESVQCFWPSCVRKGCHKPLE